jgi:hypothetical protein
VNTDKINIMPYCVSKLFNVTMNVSGSPYGREKVGLDIVKKQKKFKLLKTIKESVYILL